MVFERRKHPRNPSYIGGRIAFNHLYATVDCLIRNISHAGCRVHFAAHVALPARFVLTIPSRDEQFHARVTWRTETEAGLAFEDSRASQPVSLEMARRVRRLEEEKKQLARRVQELSEPA